MVDNLEIQDLKDCLTIEQEEKNDLNKKLQDLEKDCEISLISFSRVHINFTRLIFYPFWHAK